MKLTYTLVAFFLMTAISSYAEETPKSASEYIRRGMARFSNNQIKQSIEDWVVVQIVAAHAVEEIV